MLPAGWSIVAVVLAILLTTVITMRLTRLDRLHARVDAAQAALDSQLVRRAAALLHLAEMPGSGLEPLVAHELSGAARDALTVNPTDRQTTENRVGRCIADIAGRAATLPPDAITEISESAMRVQIARRFYNDAVRDARNLRARRMTRLFRLAGRRDMPQFFDIDDTVFVSMPEHPDRQPRSTT